MTETNNTKFWKRFAMVLILLLVVIVIIFVVMQMKKIENKKALELNQTIQSAYINGTIDGQLVLVISMHQTKEFPQVINEDGETITHLDSLKFMNESEKLRIDSIDTCSAEFYNYLNQICGVQ